MKRRLSLVLTIILTGSGWLLPVLYTALSAAPHACCRSTQHCPLSQGHTTYTAPHTRDCPQAHHAGLGPAIQTCRPARADEPASLESPRFVITRAVRLSITHPQRSHRQPVCEYSAEVAPAPPSPPPRSSFVV